MRCGFVEYEVFSGVQSLYDEGRIGFFYGISTLVIVISKVLYTALCISVVIKVCSGVYAIWS